MRDDEDIGHYLPLLRRIIILVAVITAIPVVLWTITAFVRAYVGPPKIPTFHQLASKASINEPASSSASQESRQESSQESTQESTDRMMAAAAQQAKLADPSTPTDASAPKGPLLTERAPEASMSVSPSNTPAPPPSTSIVTMSPTPAATPAAAPAMSTAATSPATMSAAAPADPWPPMPASTKASELPMPPAATTPAPSEASAPNPKVADARPLASEPAADEIPAGTPLVGPVPLPKRRPHVIAEANVKPTTAAAEPATRTEAPTRMASAGPIPMPRPRPDSAPASTTSADSSSGGPLDFISNIFGGSK